VSLTLDHVILAVPDLAAGSRELGDALGVVVEPGGEHPGWGTHNAIVRLGSSYLELIAVNDIEQARQRPRGSRLLSLLERGGGWLGFALRADDLDEAVRDLRARGMPISDPQAGRRLRPDGVELRWRTAAFEDAMWGGLLPFLIQHDVAPAAPESGVLTIEVGATDLRMASAAYEKLLGESLDGASWRLRDGCTVRLARAADTDGLQAVELRGNEARGLTVLGARFGLQVGST
jgi:catechol 2,3-dioxygenase-like lactoylglutathione lyase family enzyme